MNWTAKRRQLLGLLQTAMDQKDIASEMQIAPGTAKLCIHRLLTWLNFPSRVAFMAARIHTLENVQDPEQFYSDLAKSLFG
jgi:DNA-binding NarL/FixJ family response regulator